MMLLASLDFVPHWARETVQNTRTHTRIHVKDITQMHKLFIKVHISQIG